MKNAGSLAQIEWIQIFEKRVLNKIDTILKTIVHH